MPMTSSASARSTLQSVRRFVLGPWPLHIAPLWTLLSVMIFFTSWRLFGPQPIIAQSDSLGVRISEILAAGVLLPGLALVPLMLYRGLRYRLTDRPVRWPEYIVVLAVVSVFSAALQAVIFRDSPSFAAVHNHAGLSALAIRAFGPIWFLNAVLGSFFSRIQKESNTAQAALDVVVAQRRLLLESEERVRGQVAAFLHDRVQTDLVSIALRVRAAIGQTPDTMTRELTSIITDLERLRSHEVRRASRRLSPNLANVSLEAALRELSESYRPAMDVTILISEAVTNGLLESPDVTRATGLYRICEQGLLNAAAHGLATECSIQVTITPNNDLVLHLTDNGIGFQEKSMQPGMGSAVISAWSDALHGTWSLESATIGARLFAVIPAS